MSDQRETHDERHQSGLIREYQETERVLAETLGYPYDEVDDPGSPCPGEYVVGEHNIVTLARETAAVIAASRVTLPRCGTVFHDGHGGKRAVFGTVTAMFTSDGRVTMWDGSGAWNVSTARAAAAGLLAAVAWLEQELSDLTGKRTSS